MKHAREPPEKPVSVERMYDVESFGSVIAGNASSQLDFGCATPPPSNGC
jgi:hypothetical protein